MDRALLNVTAKKIDKIKRQCRIFNATNCDKMDKYTELEVIEHRQMFSFKESLRRLPADGQSGD